MEVFKTYAARPQKRTGALKHHNHCLMPFILIPLIIKFIMVIPYQNLIIPHPQKKYLVLQIRTQSAPLSIIIIIQSAGGSLNPACRFQIIFFSSSPLSDLTDAVLTNYGIGLQGQSGGRGAPTFWKKLGTEPDGISDCPDKFYNIFKMILCMG